MKERHTISLKHSKHNYFTKQSISRLTYHQQRVSKCQTCADYTPYESSSALSRTESVA
jgi:hypothetical protein